MITIIIADDEKLIRAGLKKILQQELDIPLHIIEAKNGQEALRAIEEHRAELLITDIRMSVMDGIELMKRIQTLEHKPEMIVLSGYDDFSYARAAIQNKVSSYLLKPVDKRTHRRRQLSNHIVAKRIEKTERRYFEKHY